MIKCEKLHRSERIESVNGHRDDEGGEEIGVGERFKARRYSKVVQALWSQVSITSHEPFRASAVQ